MCDETRPIEIATLQLKYEAAVMESSPAYFLKPRLSVDGNQWCALFGEDLQNGVAGFGDTPAKAYADFDKKWNGEEARKR